MRKLVPTRYVLPHYYLRLSPVSLTPNNTNRCGVAIALNGSLDQQNPIDQGYILEMTIYPKNAVTHRRHLQITEDRPTTIPIALPLPPSSLNQPSNLTIITNYHHSHKTCHVSVPMLSSVCRPPPPGSPCRRRLPQRSRQDPKIVLRPERLSAMRIRPW
jgi:hypothetical protein